MKTTISITARVAILNRSKLKPNKNQVCAPNLPTHPHSCSFTRDTIDILAIFLRHTVDIYAHLRLDSTDPRTRRERFLLAGAQ